MKYSNPIIIIPTYNEISNIRPLLEEIFSLELDLSVLVVDDNSPDGTSREVRKLQDVYKKLYLLEREGRRSLGSAYIDGFNYVLKERYDTVIQMDADLSHSPLDIPHMLSLLKKGDLVIGSRYVKGGGVRNWAGWRTLLSRGANIFAKGLLGAPFYDLTSGFKCIKREVLEEIDFPAIAARGYAFQIEIVYRAFRKGYRIMEHPVLFRGRENEKSKMSPLIAAEAFFRVISLCLKKITPL